MGAGPGLSANLTRSLASCSDRQTCLPTSFAALADVAYRQNDGSGRPAEGPRAAGRLGKKNGMSGKRLYVGNLAFRSTEADLESAFGAFGTVVSASVVTDRDTGRSRGFGFVEMGTDEEAQAAIDGLNDTEVDGRRIKVNVARPRENRPRRY